MMNWSEYEEQNIRSISEDFQQFERSYWPRVGAVAAAAVILGIIAGAVLYSGRVHADVAGAPDGSVKLERHETPCDDADILAHVLRMGGAHVIDKFKKATLTYGGRTWRSCWIEIDGNVLSVDEEGAPLGPIPVRAFKAVGA